MDQNSRRKFIKKLFFLSQSLFLHQNILANNLSKKKLDIALQIYSFAPLLLKGNFNLLDFPKIVRETYDMNGAEHWSIAFLGKENDKKYLSELKSRSNDNQIDNLIILVDNIDISTMKSGPSLASSIKTERSSAIDFHKKWVEVAKKIGCHSIRVNLRSNEDNNQKILENSSKSLLKLIEFSKRDKINIVVENHGGITGDADWMVNLMENINSKYLGTLPDFGSSNFCINKGELDLEGITNSCETQYDKYEGVTKLMPYAKGVSAKSHTFNPNGEELSTDFSKMIEIISKSNYSGYITVEYEGAIMSMYGGGENYLNSNDGVIATKKLLEKYI